MLTSALTVHLISALIFLWIASRAPLIEWFD
jgi:hypothetical protein